MSIFDFVGTCAALGLLIFGGCLGAWLALAELDAARPPRLGLGFRLYRAASNGWVRAAAAAASWLRERSRTTREVDVARAGAVRGVLGPVPDVVGLVVLPTAGEGGVSRVA